MNHRGGIASVVGTLRTPRHRCCRVRCRWRWWGGIEGVLGGVWYRFTLASDVAQRVKAERQHEDRRYELGLHLAHHPGRIGALEARHLVRLEPHGDDGDDEGQEHHAGIDQDVAEDPAKAQPYIVVKSSR